MANRKNDFSPRVRQIIHDRAEGVCEAMLPEVCRGSQGLQWHHRKNRSQGGMGDPENCLLVCLWCHEHIGHNPRVSYEKGWLVKMSKDPGDVHVTYRGRVVLLDRVGGYEIKEGGSHEPTSNAVGDE